MGNHTYTIGELCTITKGITGIQKAITGKYPLVVTGEERKSHNEYQFDDEAVIVPLVSGTGHGHASIKRIHYQKGKFALGSILCAIIPKDKSILSPAYLFRFLNLNKEHELVARMKGMANVTLPIREIAQIEIPLPSLSDQLEFVKRYNLLEIDSQSANLEFQRQLSIVKELRQAFLREAMQGELIKANITDDDLYGEDLLSIIKENKDSFSKNKKTRKANIYEKIKLNEIPFEIPKTWIWSRMGEVFEILNGRAYKANELLNQGTPVLRVGNFFTNNNWYYSDLKLEPNKYCENGDLLYAWSASFGPKIWDGGKVIYHYHIWKIEHSTKINRNYAYYFLKYDTELIKSSSRGVFMLHMTKEAMEKRLFPIPPLSIQNKIATKLEQLMKTCDELENSIKQSQIQNEQLLEQVLKEALDVKEVSIKKNKLLIPENKKNFAKQVLGGKIISLFKDDPNFTHIKLQKLQYLSEHIAEADLGSDYYFQTAGPYDNKFMHSISISLERSKWFKEENYRYYPLEKVDQIDQYYEGYFAPVSDKLSNLFNLLANATDTFSEIIATLYAVWNNRIIKKETLSDILLIQDFYNWSNRKQQYTKEQLVEGLEFIRVNHIEPTGFGKELKRAMRK